jgi:hypothetical protein
MMPGIREQAVSFVVDHLKKKPNITMSELRTLAKPKKINIYPLIIGYAKKQLGLGPARPRKRGPGRPPKAKRGRPARRMNDPTSAMQGVISHVRELERQSAALRALLSKIAELARSV